jgi:sphingolipid 4-desaturase/C4-monooxygenase
MSVVSLQVALALFLGKAGLRYWWASLAWGWCIGAVTNHTLYVVIHEAKHNLIFRRRVWNWWM